ncbi:hypothetical protein T265_01236 [Opisthorchis viverrini]|uniref:Uncharacterized protein n=1 Tax=Opisthorchis viverrini TaxID=6198 RepID=A0A075AAG0_OPIVI|nr:hypothetical protein T265_01236 [Opisthorchis viverrini]KER32750.1 hypothetical protein T265_01236 [Opisthorchis viverrini]
MTDTVDSQCAPDQTQQPLQQIHSKPVAVQTKWSRTKWPKISIGCKTSNGTGVALACDGTPLNSSMRDGARWLKWLLRRFTNRKVRGSNPTSNSRLPLFGLGKPGSISALMLPSGGMAARHWKGVTAERTHYLSRRPNLEEFTRIYDVANRLANLQLQRLKVKPMQVYENLRDQRCDIVYSYQLCSIRDRFTE